MDDVFGNSSSETVVSVTEFENKSKERNDSTKNKIYFLPNEIKTSNLKKVVPTAVFKQTKMKEITDRPTVITYATTDLKNFNANNSPLPKSNEAANSSEPEFKVPFLPSTTRGILRHTQSEVVSRPLEEPIRPRSHSTTTSSQGSKYHPYQNIPLSSAAFRVLYSPPYINLPRKERRTVKSVNTPPGSPWKYTNSAPSTPSGSHDTNSPRVGHSYIQLWNGIKQVEIKSKESYCSDDQLTSGYVQMSSPYVRTPNESILSDLASHLAAYAGNVPKSIFCPFCPRHFTHESNLSNHIRKNHSNELESVVNEVEEVYIQQCPVCYSKFFNLDILPNHLLEFHRGSVIELLNKHNCLKPDEGGFKCPFCDKKVPAGRVGEDVLLYHVLQFHQKEYVGLINSLFSPIVEKTKSDIARVFSIESLADFAFNPNCTSTPGLSGKFQTLSCEAAKEPTYLKLDDTWNSHLHKNNDEKYDQDEIESKVINTRNDPKCCKGILRSDIELCHKPSVKRELRFSVPPVTNEEVFEPLPSEDENNEVNDENVCNYFGSGQGIPVRVDSLSSADFIEMTHQTTRKRRRLGLGLKSRKTFKKKDKENVDILKSEKAKCIGKLGTNERVFTTAATKVFRKPVPVNPPKVPPESCAIKPNSTAKRPLECDDGVAGTANNTGNEVSPFCSMKLYSPLRIFRCNNCRIKFCDNESLCSHIAVRHKGLLGFLRPHFGCGICSAKFFENKYLVKHCLQHHTSLLEIRSPSRHKISIYKVRQSAK